MTTWRVCERNSAYEVSSCGKIRRGDRVLKPRRHTNGYVRVNLGAKQECYVHALVLETFVGPRPEGFEADHINNERSDNAVENLRWVSLTENRARRRVARGERNGCSRLTADIVEVIRASSDSSAELAQRYNVTQRHIRKIRGGAAWKPL